MPALFISCVSNEFAPYRDSMRKDFTRPNLETKIQEDFIAYGGATLEKLDEYIQHCEAVIHICGDMTGAMANKPSVEYINTKYSDFLKRIPQLQQALEGKTGLAYTQWEAYLAIYHGKRLFIVTPAETTARDSRYVKDQQQIALQQEHLKRLKELGYYAEISFSTEDELVKELYRSKLGDILNAIPKIKPINLPYHSIGSEFKGREDFVDEVHQLLNKTNGIAAIAVHGLGGMGKTRLSVEYALKYKNDYTALLFVNANSPELLRTNIANLAEPKILNLKEYDAQEEDIKYNAVINWLNQYTGWLLILDNVDTTGAAEKMEEVFAQLQHGHIIITTRIESWSNQIKKKRLDVLHEEDAVAFLLETTDGGREKKDNDHEMSETITNDLGYLALALEQARAYIVTRELSLERYRKAWQANRADVLSWFDKQQMRYPASVAITWQTSFNELSEPATTLLNRLSWLTPDPIPKTLLEVKVPEVQLMGVINAWEELKKYSLAASSEDKKTFTVHKLVQDVTRSKLDEATTWQTLNETLNWINTAFTGDPTDVRDWPYLEPLVPHALSLIEHAEANNINEPTSRLMNEVASIFWVKAQHARAEILIRKALEIDKERFGENHPNIVTGINNLAQLLKATNRLDEAEPLMRKALEIDEERFGENHPKVAIDLNNLAQLFQDTNRFEEAEPLMRKALEIDKERFGENHPNVARDINNLALLLKDTNRLGEAELLMRKALEIDGGNFGKNHPSVAIDLNNLATLLQATNRFGEAEPLMRKALEIDKESFGENHPNIARNLNNLATLLQATNRFGEAEPLMRRAFIIVLNSLGIDHPNTQTVGNNYIVLLRDMGKTEEEIQAIISEFLK